MEDKIPVNEVGLRKGMQIQEAELKISTPTENPIKDTRTSAQIKADYLYARGKISEAVHRQILGLPRL